MSASSSSTKNVLGSVTFQSDKTRRLILLSYWIVVLVGIPLWWSTTSITRLALPESRVKAQEHKPLKFTLNVAVNAPPIVTDAVERSLQHAIENKHLENVFSVTVGNEVPDSTFGYSVEIDDGPEMRVSGRSVKVGKDGLTTPSQVSDTITQLLLANFVDNEYDQRVAHYSQRYRLAFTLLNEDASSETSPYGSWDVEEAIYYELQPVLDRLSLLHNFTIESQINFHAPLAFSPIAVDTHENTYGLTPEQLTVFVNSAEWTLSSSVSNDPVLHFVIFVPTRRPLRLLDATGSISSSTAFVLPQWGSIFIYNPEDINVNSSPQHLTYSDLRPAFSTFRSQLLSLLGVSTLPPGVKKDEPLSEWQLDALMRKRSFENADGSIESLSSIVNLVHQIEGMPVGRDVQDDVQLALNYLDKMYDTAARSPRFTLHYSSKALELASRAFFNPGMLALLYFPPEHNLAVYMPLLAPVAVPLVASVLRELSKWRKSRRKPTDASVTAGGKKNQ